MSRFDPAHLELLRLARLLKVDPDRLDPLSGLPVEDLRTLRDRIAERLFEEGRDAFQRAANVANFVPAPLAAKLAEHALGPVLAARTTAVTPPQKAVELSGRFSAGFLADVAEEIDPRVVDDLVESLPPKVVAAVGRELAAREEWLVMADFVGGISSAALVATVEALSTESILRISVYLEDPDRLDEVVALLDDERLADAVTVARAEGLDEELAWITESVGDEQRARIPSS